MLSTQIIKASMEELYSVTKIDLLVYDSQGIRIYGSAEDPGTDPEVLKNFIDSPADSQVMGKIHLLKVFDEDEVSYIVAALGEGEEAHTIGRIAAGQIRILLSANKERFDKNNFFQNLLMDNLLLVDVYSRAKKLRIETTLPRVVYVIETNPDNHSLVSEALKSMFSTRAGDMISSVDESGVVLIKALDESHTEEEIHRTAQSIVDTISAEVMVNVRVGYGSVVEELKDVSKSYKEAMMAIDVGKIFSVERRVNSYSSLGIGRLIYQLPANLCRIFIDEVFGDVDPATFDEEIITTVYKFFENSLNVSETARQLFIHRNTLVYRVEKLKNLTGLDVRVFEDALTFTIAMMVYNYLRYLETQD